MTSTISVQEYAEPMCSAETCWEMSRMRRRNLRQRSRAAPASNVLLRALIGPIRSFDDRPVVVPGIAGLLERLLPAVGVVVVLGGQDPLHEHRALLGRAVGVDLDVALAGRQALHL